MLRPLCRLRSRLYRGPLTQYHSRRSGRRDQESENVDATAPGQLRFRLLGEATLHIAGGDNHRVVPQKGLALLIYLAMNRGRSVSRAVLADLLWGDRADSQARQNLRQCILTLRRDLGLGQALVAEDQSIVLAAD